MSAMEHSAVGQPSASEPQRMNAAETGTAQTTPGTLHIEHEKLPGLGSGPILPEWLRKRFRRTDTPR
jgi:hypothetical protein